MSRPESPTESPTPRVQTASLIVVGNELLSGKVRDQNTPFVTTELRRLGVRLCRVATVPDEPETIADEVRRCAAAFDWVFTSGGLGPTHDDVTLEAIALAFGVPLVQSEALKAAIANIQKGRSLASLMRLTWIPKGATLFYGPDERWPTVVMHNVYVFPGVPEFLRTKFAALRPRLRATPFATGWLYCRSRETELVPQIEATCERFSDVEIGSYPQFGDTDHKLRLTFDHPARERVEAAMDDFVARVGPDELLRRVVDHGAGDGEPANEAAH